MIKAIATATRAAWRPRWALAFLAAVLAVAVGPFGAGPESAAAACAAQTRVGASHSTVGVVVGSSTGITAGRRLGNDPPWTQMVVATGVAASTGVRCADRRPLIRLIGGRGREGGAAECHSLCWNGDPLEISRESTCSDARSS